MKGNNNLSYKTYLENQQVAAYSNNRKLRVKSDFQKGTTQKQPEQHYQSTNIKNQPSINSNSIYSAKPKRFKTHQFPTIQQQQQSQMNKRKIKNSYITIPYNTEQINRNVSKVLSDIQQIQSQFRKLSSQNSMHLKQSKHSQFQYTNQETREKKSSFLDSLMDKIKKPIKYQQKSNDYITKEKSQLVSLVKNLNKKLNQRLKQVQKDQLKSNTRQTISESKFQEKRRIQSDMNEQQPTKHQRIPSSIEFQKSIVHVVEQINTNQKLIENMKHQLQFLNKKYEGYQNSLKNYKSTQHTVSQLRNMIKKKKQQISRIRKKKFLTEKSIISIQKRNGSLFAMNSTDILSTNCSTSTHSNDILSSLKQEYSEYLKKRDKMKNKLQLNKIHLNRIEELKDKNNVNKQHYEELVEEMKRLDKIKEQQEDEKEFTNKYRLDRSRSIKSNKKVSQTQQQHLQFMYKTKKSKLQMLMNTIKRNDQSYKRKYYKLLKQYQSMVEQQSDSALSSPSKALTVSKNFNHHIQIVDQKLDKSKLNIIELENKIQRLRKIGKIVKKVNNLHFNNNQDESNYENEYFQQQESQEQGHSQQSESQKNNNKNNNIDHHYDRSFMKKNDSHSKSLTTPLNKNQNIRLLPNRNSQPKQRIISASSYINTPNSELSLKDYTQRYEKQSSFLAQNDKSFQQLDFGTDYSRPLSYNINPNQQKKKYIGKFKKQRIVHKYAKTNSAINDNENRLQSLLMRRHNKYDEDKNRPLILNNYKQTIIQQQIQVTNSLESSQYRPKMSTSSNRQQISNQWDQKILNLLKDNNEKDIDQEIEETNQEIKQNQDKYYGDSSGFQPQKQSRMLMLKQQFNKEDKQKQIKQKYSNILYKSKLFN